MEYRTSIRYREGYRYGIWDIDFGYGISMRSTQYRYGHPGYRYGIWANDIGDDSIDMVILIDMEYLVTLPLSYGTQSRFDIRWHAERRASAAY